MRAFIGLCLALFNVSFVTPAGAQSAECKFSAEPVFLPVAEQGTAVLIDDQCRYIYTAAGRRLTVYSLESGKFETPIEIDGFPFAIDVTADGKTLYVIAGNDSKWTQGRSGPSVAVIDLVSRRQIAKIDVPAGPGNHDNAASSVAVMNDGTVFIGTEYNGGGGGHSRVVRAQPTASGPSGPYTLSVVGRSILPGPSVRATRNRQTILFNELDGLGLYTTQTGTALAGGSNIDRVVATDATGSVVLLQRGRYDARAIMYSLQGGSFLHRGAWGEESGRVFGAREGNWIAIRPDGGTAFISTLNGVDVVNLTTMKLIRHVPSVGDMVEELAVSTDGSLLVMRTRRGIVLTPANAPAFPTPPVVRLAPVGGYASSAPCNEIAASPIAIASVGTVKSLKFDRPCNYVFATNNDLDEVDVYSVHTGAFVTAIPVGNAPTVLDTNVEGTTLYVGNSGDGSVSVIDLTRGTQTRKIALSNYTREGAVTSLAVASTGNLWFTLDGNNQVGEYDVRQNRTTWRTFTYFDNSRELATAKPRLKASGDRKVIGIAGVDGDFHRYSVATDSSASRRPKRFGRVALGLDHTGAKILADNQLYDESLKPLLNLPLPGSPSEWAMSPNGTTAFGADSANVEVWDLIGGVSAGRRAGGTEFDGSPTQRLAMSEDGSLLANATETGFSIIRGGESAKPGDEDRPTAGSGTVTPCDALLTRLDISIASEVTDILIDDDCRHVYAVNRSLGFNVKVQVFSLATRNLLGAIGGGKPSSGIDASSDGRYLYVAQMRGDGISLGNNILQLDLTTGNTLRTFNIPLGENRTSTESLASLAVANDGRVFVTSAPTGRIFQFDPVSREVRERPDLGLAHAIRASSSRNMIGLLTRNGTSATVKYYDVASDTLRVETAEVEGASQIALDETGAIGLSGSSVLDSRLNARQLTSGGAAVLGTAISPDGRLAFRSTTNGEIEVYNAATAASTGLALKFGPVSTARHGNVGKMAISRDGTLIAAITETGFSVIPARTPPVPIRFTALTGGDQSYLRLYNSGAYPGSVSLRFASAAIGIHLASWTSPTIAPGSVQQFSMSAIAREVLRSERLDGFYSVTAEADATFVGHLQQVLWRPNNRLLVNVTACNRGISSDPFSLSAVHSSLVGDDVTSTLLITNTGSRSASVILDIYDARDGRLIGEYVTGTVDPGKPITVTMPQIERRIGISPAGDAYHYVVVARNLTGFVQHIVGDRLTGTMADMTTTCSLGSHPVSRAPATSAALGVLSSSVVNAGAASVLRVTNTDSIDGRATVELSISDTNGARQVREWRSSVIGAGAFLDVAVAEIEEQVGPLYPKPDFYLASMRADFAGTLKHLVHLGSAGEIANFNTCSRGPAALSKRIEGVRSPATPGNPGYLVLTNTGSTARTATLRLEDARTGARLGAYEIPDMAPNATAMLDIPSLERGSGMKPTAEDGRYNVAVDGLLDGFMQHLSGNLGTGWIAQMTTACHIR